MTSLNTSRRLFACPSAERGEGPAELALIEGLKRQNASAWRRGRAPEPAAAAAQTGCPTYAHAAIVAIVLASGGRRRTGRLQGAQDARWQRDQAPATTLFVSFLQQSTATGDTDARSSWR
jgi:hypothetical protein